MKEALSCLYASIAKLTSLLNEIKCLTSLLQILSQLVHDELRTHYLSEIHIFFPPYSLKGLQCRFCVQDKFCWRKQTQGYICGLYFMSKHPDPSVQGRRLYLSKMQHAEEDIVDIITNADFFDLLTLCSIKRANLRILSKITNYGLRDLLFQIVDENNSINPLTITNYEYIL